MPAPIHSDISEIWIDILGLDTLAEGASFFDLGGTSIEAEQIAARLNERFGSKVRGTDILRATTVEGVAAVVRRQLESAPPSFQRETA
jgi:dihydroaeruginoic acid synthetase